MQMSQHFSARRKEEKEKKNVVGVEFSCSRVKLSATDRALVCCLFWNTVSLTAQSTDFCLSCLV